MENISEILKGVKSVAISGHVRPDGDCVGSCLGLYNYIIDNYKDIEPVVFLENVSGFSFLNGSDKVLNTASDKKFDLYVSLDTSNAERIGVMSEVYINAENTVNIDHHVSNTNFAEKNFVYGGRSSCAEVLFYLLDEDKISKNTAEALYTGMIHDSAVFKYQSTNKLTMNAAGSLMEKGIDFTSIIDNSFYAKSYRQTQILGRAMLESMLLLDGKVAVSVIDKDEMEFYQVDSSELSGIVEQLRLIEGVECAVFAYQIGNLEYKVSLRSKNYLDVNAVASYFGGGGHVRAAGATMQGTAHDVINNVVRKIADNI